MVSQLAIGFFGLLSIALSLDHRESVRRWTPILGLLMQPFWFWASWHAQQWGIFTLSFAYTLLYLRFLVAYWRPRKKPRYIKR